MPDDCIFCKIVRGEIPATSVYQDDSTFAFRDINPGAPSHILIIPKEHLTSLADMDATKEALMGHMVHVAAQIARTEGIDKTGYRLVSNIGKDGGQSVFHLHWHLLGGRSLTWPPG